MTAKSDWAGRTAAQTWRSQFVAAQRRHGKDKVFLKVCDVDVQKPNSLNFDRHLLTLENTEYKLYTTKKNWYSLF